MAREIGFKSQKGYSSFQMRPDLDFTTSVGHMIPVLYDFLYPGDKVDVSFKLKTRTMPLDAAAYGEFKECIDTFFVPIEQIYHNFKNQIYGILDFDSDFFANPGASSSSYIPYMPNDTISDLFSYLQSVDGSSGSFSFGFNTRGLNKTSMKSESLRLLDALGFPIYACYGVVKSPSITIGTSMSFNFWNLCAYQKIWMDHYRLSDRIDNDATTYNVDSFYNSPFLSLTQADRWKRLESFISMNYCPYDDDFFTKNYTSPIIGSQSIGLYPSTAMTKVNQWLSNISSIATVSPGSNALYPVSDPNSPTSVSMSLVNSSNATYTTVGNNINSANIRSIFASEKLLEVTRRAGKHYDAQTLAHFGIKVPVGISGESYFIGHHEQDLVIGEVVSTSETQITDSQGNLKTNPLGQIGGRGFSLGSSKDVRFSAPCHGILMSIFYVKPVAKYKQTWFDKLNTLINPSDYMTPEMDSIGMQPLFGYQVDFHQTATYQAAIYGWQFRYNESKDKPKRVIGALADSLDYWTFWRPGVSSSAGSYYVSPADANNLFLLQWDGLLSNDDTSEMFPAIYSNIYENDNFLHSLAIGYNKASKMSVSGSPNL